MTVPIIIFIALWVVVFLLLWFALCFNENDYVNIRTDLLKLLSIVISAVCSWINTILYASGSVGEVVEHIANETTVSTTDFATNTTTTTTTYMYDITTTIVQNNLITTMMIIGSFAITAIALYYVGSCLYDMISAINEANEGDF